MQKMVSNIVFTKNRPLQLDAYLESLYRYFPSQLIQTYILYKPELFEKEYQQLFDHYPDCVIVKESDFHSDFLRLLSQINTKYILFGIDDVVYFDSVDFEVVDETFSQFSKDIFGFSFRLSKENVNNGGDTIYETVVAGQTVFRIDWTQGRTPNTRYPFELCATIYRTELVKRIINGTMNNNPVIKKLFSPGSALIKAWAKVISTRSILKSFGYFYNPNTLESWNCRWCQRHSNELPGSLFFQKLCASAIQVNMVNITARKKFEDVAGCAVEALAEKYNQGFRMDIDFITQNKPSGTHCGIESFRLRKGL